MKIIAECGATKSDWRLISEGVGIKQVLTPGINVSAMSRDAVKTVIDDALGQLGSGVNAVDSIHLYVAGVVTEQIQGELMTLISAHYPLASIEIQSDLLAAARAVCGCQPGIAAIVGTGSNSCLYDGEKIVSRVCSGGFVLGDDGSAATLGRLFLSDLIKNLVPEEIAKEFSSRFPSDYSSIISSIYHSAGSPSGYLGSIAPFILEHYSHPYIQNLVDENFRSFIRRSLKQYDTDKYPVGVVGGFAYALKDIFSRIAAEEGIALSCILKAPVEGLVKYHNSMIEPSS